jgi:DnaK suppressor protein
MRERRLEKIHKRLIDLREDLLREVREKNAQAAALTDQRVPDVGDQSLSDNLGEFLHLLSDSKREEILKIDEALDRLNSGRYGRCQECGETIPIERLEVAPYTRFCLDCKKRREEEEDRKRGPLGKSTL